MLSDRVVRLNPKTDEIVEYLLPRSTNIRRVFAQDTGPRPVLWVGNNNGAAIIEVTRSAFPRFESLGQPGRVGNAPTPQP
jgi:hypothetical protein